MKKILISINNLGHGGAERVVVNEINEMISRGIDVCLLTLKKERNLSIFCDCNLNPSKWYSFDFKNIYDIKSWVDIFVFFKKNKFDLIVTHLWFSNTILRTVAFFIGFKNIISFEQNIYDDLKNRKMFFLDRLLQYNCRKIIAVSDAVKDSLIKNGIKKENIEIIYNAVNTKKFINAKTYEYSELGLSNRKFIFLFVGRLIHQKGVDILIKAFHKANLDSYLLIVGGGELENELKNYVLMNRLSEKIYFMGIRNDVDRLMASCNCFVLPSRYEGLPLVIAEAMSVGVPILISNFKSSLGIIKNNVNGIVVPVDDIYNLSTAMINIFSNKKLSHYISKNALKDSDKFSIDLHVNKILSYI